jgi:hypothetical protein
VIGGKAMRGRGLEGSFPGVVAAALMGLVLLGLAGPTEAQSKTGSAEIKAVSGKVEIQRKGETSWLPAVVGAKLVEGDNLRAWEKAAARMDLPDGSTIFLAENSRVVVGKLEFDQQNQARVALFHLAVGKVRAVVSQAALSLVKARQSNFAISTQTTVAAVRGTDFEVTYDEANQVTRIAVLPEEREGS